MQIVKHFLQLFLNFFRGDSLVCSRSLVVLFGTPEESQLYRQEDFPAVALNPSPKRLSAPFVPIKTFSARGMATPRKPENAGHVGSNLNLIFKKPIFIVLSPQSTP
jgi:hypothetical protein